MAGLQHQVLLAVDQGGALASRRAPEQEGDRRARPRDRLDRLVGQRRPAELHVCAGLAGLDGQRGVEQEHALARPARKVAGGRDRGAGLLRHLGEDHLERGRQPAPADIREGEAVGVARGRVGVLAEDHRPHVVERRQGERVEDVLRRRQHPGTGFAPGIDRLRHPLGAAVLEERQGEPGRAGGAEAGERARDGIVCRHRTSRISGSSGARYGWSGARWPGCRTSPRWRRACRRWCRPGSRPGPACRNRCRRRA